MDEPGGVTHNRTETHTDAGAGAKPFATSSSGTISRRRGADSRACLQSLCARYSIMTTDAARDRSICAYDAAGRKSRDPSAAAAAAAVATRTAQMAPDTRAIGAIADQAVWRIRCAAPNMFGRARVAFEHIVSLAETAGGGGWGYQRASTFPTASRALQDKEFATSTPDWWWPRRAATGKSR